MNKEMVSGLVLLDEQEAAFIFGGVDKKAQDALYTIGFVIGLIVRFIATLFTFKNKQAATA